MEWDRGDMYTPQSAHIQNLRNCIPFQPLSLAEPFPYQL
jgi:hypothetical protein